MGFCPQCGRAVDPTLHFCPSCGATRAPAARPAAAPPPPPAPGAAPPYGQGHPGPGHHAPTPAPWGHAPPPSGPPGRVEDPGKVVLLSILTLNVYGFIFWWRASREADAYVGREGHAHGKVRLGTWLSVAGMVAIFVGYAVFLVTILANFDPENPESMDAGGFAAGMLLILAAYGLMIAGYVLLLIGWWRVWKVIEEDERRRGVPDGISPGLQLFFVLMPLVNLVTMWIAYWNTQKGLNGIWERAAPQHHAWTPPPRAP